MIVYELLQCQANASIIPSLYQYNMEGLLKSVEARWRWLIKNIENITFLPLCDL